MPEDAFALDIGVFVTSGAVGFLGDAEGARAAEGVFSGRAFVAVDDALEKTAFAAGAFAEGAFAAGAFAEGGFAEGVFAGADFPAGADLWGCAADACAPGVGFLAAGFFVALLLARGGAFFGTALEATVLATGFADAASPGAVFTSDALLAALGADALEAGCFFAGFFLAICVIS